MPRTRNSSFELLKVIAIVLICFSSALPFGAMYQGTYKEVYINLSSVNTVKTTDWGGVLTLFRWFGQIGDTLFIMCSAWFLCESNVAKNNKYLKLIFDSFVISVFGLLFACIFISPSLKEVLKSIFPVTFQNNWFVGCYIIYYLMHPLLNNAVRDFNKENMSCFVTVIFVAYSIIATIYPSYYFTNLVAFIMIHYVVSWCRKYDVWEHDSKYDVLIIVTCFVILLLMIVAVKYIGQYFGFLENKNLWLCHFYNPIIVGLVLPALFLAARNEFKSKTINGISSLSLFTYLIHGNYFWQAYGKYATIGIFMEMGISKFEATLMVFFGIVITSLFISKIYMLTFGKLTEKIATQVAEKYFGS